MTVRPARKHLVTCLLVVSAVGLLGGVLLTVAAALYAKPLMVDLVTRRAERYGIVLKFEELDFGWGWISLERVDFRLVGVQGARGRAERIKVDLEGLTPTKAAGQGVRFEAEGPIVTLLLDLSQWIQRYALTLKLRLEAREMDVVWREQAGGPAWLNLSRGELSPSASGVAFKTANAQVAGARLGELRAGWDVNDSYLDLGLGDQSTTRAPVRLVLYHAIQRPTLEITLRPMLLERLAQPFGATLPVRGVIVSGTTRLVFPPRGQSGDIDGTAAIKLLGWVPPHPPELDGFVFGNETTFDTRLSIASGYRNVTLKESRLKAGAFVLDGGGTITRYDTHARVWLDLRGRLPCSALAGAVAESNLGRLLGPLAGSIAQFAVQGSVAVTVQLDADTRHLAAAKLTRAIGVGCGLRPIPIPGMGQIDLGKLPGMPKIGDLPLPNLGDLTFP